MVEKNFYSRFFLRRPIYCPDEIRNVSFYLFEIYHRILSYFLNIIKGEEQF